MTNWEQKYHLQVLHEVNLPLVEYTVGQKKSFVAVEIVGIEASSR